MSWSRHYRQIAHDGRLGVADWHWLQENGPWCGHGLRIRLIGLAGLVWALFWSDE